MKTQQLKGLAWLALAIFLALAAAAGLPLLARSIPWSLEKKMADFVDQGSTLKICAGSRHPEAAVQFRKIVQRLYPVYPADNEFPLTIEVASGHTVNAFANLGGHVYVFEGLIKEAKSPEELAGVLAHEIEHVRHRHILQGALVRLLTGGALRFIVFGGKRADPEIANMLLNMRFSRDQEAEADEGGLKRLQDARIDVSGFFDFFDRLSKMPAFTAILSDHPSNDSRAKLAELYRGRPVKPLMDQKDWNLIKTICD